MMYTACPKHVIKVKNMFFFLKWVIPFLLLRNDSVMFITYFRRIHRFSCTTHKIESLEKSISYFHYIWRGLWVSHTKNQFFFTFSTVEFTCHRVFTSEHSECIQNSQMMTDKGEIVVYIYFTSKTFSCIQSKQTHLEAVERDKLNQLGQFWRQNILNDQDIIGWIIKIEDRGFSSQNGRQKTKVEQSYGNRKRFYKHSIDFVNVKLLLYSSIVV